MHNTNKKLSTISKAMRIKKTVTLPKDVVEWLEAQIKERRFSNVSHGIEFCVYQLIQKESQKEAKSKKATNTAEVKKIRN